MESVTERRRQGSSQARWAQVEVIQAYARWRRGHWSLSKVIVVGCWGESAGSNFQAGRVAFPTPSRLDRRPRRM